MSAQATRERIVEAATSLFAAGGYAGTSTRELGAAGGANVATIAYHFGDKEGLYHAALDRCYERLVRLELPAALPKGRDDRIRVVVAHIYRFCRGEQDAVRLLLRHVLEHGGLPRAVRDRWNERLLARLPEVGAALGLPELGAHGLPLLSLNHLVARYAVSDPEDVMPFIEGEETQEAVAEHLGEIAVGLLMG